MYTSDGNQVVQGKTSEVYASDDDQVVQDEPSEEYDSGGNQVIQGNTTGSQQKAFVYAQPQEPSSNETSILHEKEFSIPSVTTSAVPSVYSKVTSNLNFSTSTGNPQ